MNTGRLPSATHRSNEGSSLISHVIRGSCLVESNPLIELGSDLAIAIYGNLLIRYAARKAEAEGILMLVLPVLVAIS